MELLFNIVEFIAICAGMFFGVGLFVMFMCWPINDDQNQAPLWVMCIFIKKSWNRLVKAINSY